MTDAYVALSEGRAHTPSRGVVPVDRRHAVTLLMGCHLDGHDEALAAKIVSVFPENREQPTTAGVAIVLDPTTGEPLALIDGTFLTAWRTGAATGAATALLARPDARVGAMIGAGGQAATQIVGIDTARELDRILVYGPTETKVTALIDSLRGATRAELVAAPSAAAAIAQAQVICTATCSETPVIDGHDVIDGAHVNAIGAFRHGMREIDAALISRARVFVDSRAAALEEAGDLVAAQAEGATAPASWTELGEVAAGSSSGRASPDEITVFKSVGQAVQDVVAGARALARAKDLGIGRLVRW